MRTTDESDCTDPDPAVYSRSTLERVVWRRHGNLHRGKDPRPVQDASAAAWSGGDAIPSGATLERQLRYAELTRKLTASGSEAPAVIRAIRPGQAEPVTGALAAEFEVMIKPPDGEAFAATIKQPMAPAALEAMSAGEAVTVRYDPADPTSALIYGGL
jgi:hypothetical protein